MIGPSNPVISIGPILSVPGMREAIADSGAPVVAVSPFVAGQAVKGPTEKFMTSIGRPATAAGHRLAVRGRDRGDGRRRGRPRSRAGGPSAPGVSDAHGRGGRQAPAGGAGARFRPDAGLSRVRSATAILPVKRFGAAKRRLLDALDGRERVALVGAMLADVLGAVARAKRVERVIVVTGERRAERIALEQAKRAPMELEVLRDPKDFGHSEAATIGIVRAKALEAECAVLLPGDCPLLDPTELDAAIGRASIGSGHGGAGPAWDGDQRARAVPTRRDRALVRARQLRASRRTGTRGRPHRSRSSRSTP